MAFFNWFGKSKPQVAENGDKDDEDKSLPEIKREDFVDDSDPKNDERIIIRYGTGMPIDLIYAYIDKDYEQVGYDDAICNVDNTYKESKKEIIHNGLKRLFEQVRLKYRGDLRDLDVQIGIVEQQGMINTAEALKARKETFLEHLKTINEMEQCLDKKETQMYSMIYSYERGFYRGLAARAQSYLNNSTL